MFASLRFDLILQVGHVSLVIGGVAGLWVGRTYGDGFGEGADHQGGDFEGERHGEGEE